MKFKILKKLFFTIALAGAISFILSTDSRPVLALSCEHSNVSADWWVTSGCSESCNCSAGRLQMCCTSATHYVTTCNYDPLSGCPWLCNTTTQYLTNYCYNLSTSCSCCTCNSTCTLPLCPSGSSTTGTYGFRSQVSCSLGSCGNCGTRTANCYCTSPCNPTECSSTYSTTDKGVGIAVTYNCVNACNYASTRNCYYYPCNDCDLPACPTDTHLSSDTEDSDYPYTTISCTTTKTTDCRGPAKTATCYENKSNQPYLTSLTTSGNSTELGFSSSTTSGIYSSTLDLNAANQPLSVQAVFRDPDINGGSQIEATSFWFSTSTTTPTTPYYIDTSVDPIPTPRTLNSNNFGFMLHKEVVGGLTTWIPYVPSMNGSDTQDKWIRADVSGEWYNIVNNTGATIAQIKLVSNPAIAANTVTVNYQIKFLEVVSGTYNMFTLAHDVFGFTPRDNYSPNNTRWNTGEIRNSSTSIRNPIIGPVTPNYARDWKDSNQNWRVDLEKPSVDTFEVTVLDENTLQLNWDVSDNQGLYGIVGNIYAADGLHGEGSESPDELSISVNGALPIVYTPSNQPSDPILGHLTNDVAFKAIGTAVSGSATIDLNSNQEGSLLFYLTVFDMGGNTDVLGLEAFSLEEWFVTKGGLAYSSNDYSFSVRRLDAGVWDGSTLLNVGFLPERADISSEMWGSNAITAASALLHSSTVDSYNITGLNYSASVEFYEDFKDIFNKKKADNVSAYTQYTPPNNTLSGDMCAVSGCGGKTMYNTFSGTPTVVSSGFQCNGRGVFFVEGDLTINPNMTNDTSSKDACIFVVQGDVTINPGSSAPVASGPGYDEVNAFILTEGIVSIPFDSSNDGLLIKGGVYTPNANGSAGINSSIVVERKLPLTSRNVFPVFAVTNHPKYGIFSKNIFGNTMNIVKTEVGFKPY